MTVPPDKQLGSYEFISPFGEAGMGEVCRRRDDFAIAEKLETTDGSQERSD